MLLMGLRQWTGGNLFEVLFSAFELAFPCDSL